MIGDHVTNPIAMKSGTSVGKLHKMRLLGRIITRRLIFQDSDIPEVCQNYE